MSITFTDGIVGVGAPDMEVWMQTRSENYGAGGDEYIEVTPITSTALLSTATTFMEKIGELKKDSINIKGDAGDTAEGNTVGTIVLNKSFELTFNIMNLTVANINGLEAIDGQAVDLLIIDSSGDASARKVIIAYNVIFNYTEDLKSGQLQEIPVKFTKKALTLSDVRKITQYPTS